MAGNKEQKRILNEAEALYKQGRFEESCALLLKADARAAGMGRAYYLTGSIALLENRLDDAINAFKKALEKKPGSRRINSMLAEVYYRKDDFKSALLLADKHRRKALWELAKQIQSESVCEITSPGKTELLFIRKDPIPVVTLSVNGSAAHFLIDTGGGDLIIDPRFAGELGIEEAGPDRSVFGGGKAGSYTHARIDSLQMGDTLIKNLPAMLLDTRRFSAGLFGNEIRVDGILGTGIMRRFLTTLDYAAEKIIFERPLGAVSREKYTKEGYTHIPFWMAGDHFMLVRGFCEAREMLMFLDTGLGGAAFTCPRSTLRECGFSLDKRNRFFGLGGGGSFRSIPFVVGSLQLGNIEEKNLHGIYGAFPPALERNFGFRIGGLISHEFFKHHNVVFDFSNMRLYIK